jgi:hypothetical protein
VANLQVVEVKVAFAENPEIGQVGMARECLTVQPLDIRRRVFASCSFSDGDQVLLVLGVQVEKRWVVVGNTQSRNVE